MCLWPISWPTDIRKATSVFSLSLKYTLALRTAEQVGTNVNGEEYKLSDYLTVSAVISDVIEPGKLSRKGAEAILANGTNEVGFGVLSKSAALLKGEADYVQLVIGMPSSVGNEANPQKGKEAKISFALEKCLHPKNPLYADNGLGCGASKIKCFGLLSIALFIWAGLPHKINTIGSSLLFNIFITSSVNISQPLFLCEAGLCSSTVNTELSNNTPCSAHSSKSEAKVIKLCGISKSITASFMISNEGDNLTTSFLFPKQTPVLTPLWG